MKPPKTPEFLARKTYRLRRLMDAARLLPIFGLILLLLPLMRHSPELDAPPTATEGVYLFAVWAVLILTAFVMSLWLRRTLEQSAEPPRPDPPGPSVQTPAPTPDEG